MINGYRLSSLALMLTVLGQTPLLATTGTPPLVKPRLIPTQTLAQVNSTRVAGELDEASSILDDGSYFNVHTFEGTAGEQIRIDLISEAFDAYLLLVGPDGSLLAQDDDSGEGTNARLVVRLPVDGTYQVIANSFSTGETGPYALSWQIMTTGTASQAPSSQRTYTLTQQAAEFYQAGRYGEAIPLLQEAVEILRQQLGNRHPDVASSLSNLATLYLYQGRYGESESLYLEAFGIYQEYPQDSRPFEVATNLNGLASLYRFQGRYAEAEPLYLEALTIFREQLGNDHPEVAGSLNNLAGLYEEQDRYGEAEPLYLEALTIFRAQLGDDHPNVATSLNNLAGLYQSQGNYAEAEPLYLEVLAIDREQLGERHPAFATSISNLALLYWNQSRYGEAEPLLLEALNIRRQQLGNNHPDVATSLNNLALLYQDQGRYGEVEPLLLEALSIRRQQLGNNHPDVAQPLNELASLYLAQGRFREAESRFLEAIAIRREQLGDNHTFVAHSLNDLALLYSVQNRYEEAETLYLESLDITREQFGGNHPFIASSLNNLARLYWTQGRYDDAQPLTSEALAIRREQLGENHPDVANSFASLTLLYWAQGDLAAALQSKQAGLAIEEVNFGLNLASLAEAQRQEYAATLSDSTDIALSIHLQGAAESPEAAAMALNTLLRRKGRIFDAGVDSLQRLRQNLSPSDQQRLDELNVLRSQLATLIFNPPENLNRADIDQLETEINQREAALARNSSVFRAEAQPIDITSVAAHIPDNGILVEYLRYFPFDPTAPRKPWGNERYAAYLLFPDGNIQAIDLGDATAIDVATKDFSQQLQNLDQSPTAAAHALTTQILGPLLPYLDDSQHLLISPDSQLNRIPFEALRTAENRYLIQDYQISYLNSGRDLLKLDVTEPSQQTAVVIANPDYETASGSLILEESAGVRAADQRSFELSRLQVGPLPGTAAEAEAIQQHLPNADILTAEQATENALKQVQAPRILHIATHGFFLANVERPQVDDGRGLGVVSADSGLGSRLPGANIENPLLRSGLALAGFNSRSSGSEDGVLTALEAANLDLSGTQLVVLSACDTGLGDIVNGEGVYGLRRAFAAAGAETQLISLWQVDDFGTSELMASYYERLLDGQGRSEALRDVQLELIGSGSRYAHPYYWAAFITTGDWRPLE